jgi:isoleucyl-tRNA synthetase
VQQAIKGAKSGDWSVAADGTVTAGGLVLVEGEYALETVAGAASDDQAVGMLPTGGFVVLDTVVTAELATEGLARDLVRAVQQARKDAGFHVEDRIELTIAGDEAVRAAATTHQELIAQETLATSYAVVEAVVGTEVALGDGASATVAVALAD